MSNNVNVDNTVQNASITISVKQLIVVLGVVLSSLSGVYLKLSTDITSSKTSVEKTVSDSKTELTNEIHRLDNQNREDYKGLDGKIQKLVEFHMNSSVPTSAPPPVN